MIDVLHQDLGPSRRTRLIVFAAVGALLLLFGLLGTSLTREGSDALPAISRSGENQAWFCPLTVPSGRVAIQSTGASGSADFVVATSDRSTEASIGFGAGELKTFGPSDLVAKAPAGSTVRVPRDGVVVSHAYNGTVAPVNCQNRAESRLVFTENTTSQGASTTLALFNPFFDPAVVDVSFNTDVGSIAPKNMQGIVVSPRSLKLIDTGAEVTRRSWITTIVTTRSGRIAAETTQSSERLEVDRFIAGPAPLPRSSWFSPPSDPSAPGNDVLSLVNTSSAEVGVQVSVSATGRQAIEPFEMRVPAEGRVILDLRNEGRLPKDAPLEIRVDGQNGAQVIASRTLPGPVSMVGNQRWAYLQER